MGTATGDVALVSRFGCEVRLCDRSVCPMCVPAPPVLSNREPSINANRGFANKVFQRICKFLRFEPTSQIENDEIMRDIVDTLLIY